MSKETTKKMKRQPMGLQKIFANDIADNGLVYGIY